MTLSLLGRFLLAGVLSTVSMDLGATLLRKAGLTQGVPPEYIARWFGHLFKGQLTHQTIANASDVKGFNLPVALAFHYLIGITLTAGFWLLLTRVGARPLGTQTVVLLALSFGFATNVLPWLLMFPAMGFGAFGKDAPAELMLFRTSLLNHVCFGVGLMWTALAFARVRS